MRVNHYILLITLFAITLAGCSKSGDDVTPTNNTDLLIRKWAFLVNVKTDAKTYAIPANKGNVVSIVSDDNTLTFKKDGTFSYIDAGKAATGKWTLTNKSLVLIDADNVTSNWTVNTLTATDLELGSVTVNLTKGNDLTNSKIYTSEEQAVGAVSLLSLASLDKQNGGTVDFTKEPQAKSVQLVLAGKGQ